MKKRVVVVGSGVIGLSTAYNILQSMPDTKVTIVAEKFSPDLTSDVAAGLIAPHLTGPTPAHLLRRWCKKTFDHVASLHSQPNAPQIGISFLSIYDMLLDNNEPESVCSDLLYGFRQMTGRELNQYPKCAKGYFFTSYMCEGYLYLPWLMEKYRNLGGLVIQRKLQSLNELYADYDIVVNCTGVASNQVNGDVGTQPSRGQVVRVYAPWIKHAVLHGSFYIIPGSQYVVLGGTEQLGNWNTAPSDEDTRNILDGCATLIPSLKNAQAVKVQVGLRPYRPNDPIRLEAETVTYHGKTIPVVHNYGHGGAGVSLHWGCAQDATELVRQAIQSMPVNKSRL